MKNKKNTWVFFLHFEAFPQGKKLSSNIFFWRLQCFTFFRNNLDAVVVIGDSDPSLYDGQLSYIDLLQPGKYYRIPIIAGIKDQPNLVCSGNEECSAVIDTGSPFMYGPISKIKVICEAIGGIVSWFKKWFTV